MDERSTGIRAVLKHPRVYQAFQDLVGGERARRTLVAEHVRPAPGEKVLDLGCGPAELLPLLGDVDYVGIDLSPAYIRSAQERYGDRADLRVGDATLIDADVRDVDVVVAFGVLHHIGDDGVRAMLRGAGLALRDGGRVMTVDPTFADGQARAARAMIARDRGQHVRTPDAYAALARQAFGEVEVVVRHDLLRMPYTHCVLECRAPSATT